VASTTVTCSYCGHEGSDHYGPDAGRIPDNVGFANHPTCHLCDKERAIRDQRQSEERRQKQVRNWVVAAIIAAIIAGILIHNSGEHDAAFNAGAAWARQEMAAGYATSAEANYIGDSNPCDDSQAIAGGSAGYNFPAWLSGCQSVAGD
jgi:hypothetical protein